MILYPSFFVNYVIKFDKVGLTTQVPNVIEIVTNECKNNNKYVLNDKYKLSMNEVKDILKRLNDRITKT